MAVKPGNTVKERDSRHWGLGVVRNHLMPDGRLPGSSSSDTVWTGCDGPQAGSRTDRVIRVIGLLSWVLVAVLAVWLHLTRLDGFLEAFPLVLGAKVLVFLWVLFGVSILRPIFAAKSRKPLETTKGA